MIIGLLGIFKKRFNAGRPAARFLSERAFGVYVFHPPVLLAISTALKGLALQPLLKFAVVAVPAVAGSFAVSYLVRRIGFLRRVFS
jgi:surface polysaccharide O-acyltransferase-like enzyme